MSNTGGQLSNSNSTKRICSSCIGESYLKRLIQDQGVDFECSYCEETSKTFLVNELADLIEKAFEDHYERTSVEPDSYEAMRYEGEIENGWERHGTPVQQVIMDIAGISKNEAADVLSILEQRHYDHDADNIGEECEFSQDSYYEKKDPGCGDFSEKWANFEHELKSKSRFYSISAKKTLNNIFLDIETLRTNEDQPVIVTVGPNNDIKVLYRARVFAGEDEKLKEAIKQPWKHFGPPPMHAASAGRMNAYGISVFYGALDSKTALSEVRPPVGSKVAIAKFTIEQTLRLLDVKALNSVTNSSSIFDPKCIQQIQRANFLKTLSERISCAVMPNQQSFEYLTTQVIADYLACEAKLDGIIFPSVQSGPDKTNVILFHQSSRVADNELPIGIRLQSHIEEDLLDGPTTDYRVWEEVALPEPLKPTPRMSFPTLNTFNDISNDDRPISLKVDLNNIYIHHVISVSHETNEYQVWRHGG